MIGDCAVPRGRAPIAAGALTALATAFVLVQSGCLGPDSEGQSYLSFRNPELTAGFDSLNVWGVNARKGDTLLIHHWLKGEDFPAEAAYPPGLEAAFTLLVRGYIKGILVYQSRTAIAGGKAQAQVRDYRLAAPALPDLPLALAGRIGDAIELDPVWETRPGIYRQADSGGAEVYTPEADFAWSRAGKLLGSDSVLGFKSLALADSGAYVFAAANRAGRDSMTFKLTVKQMLPRISEIKPQSSPAGSALTVSPVITRSDSLLFRWMKDGITVSVDTALKFDSLGARDTGLYQLEVSNASDTTETALSNHFTVGFTPNPVKRWSSDYTVYVGAQANSTYGTSLDLDAHRAIFYDEANKKPALIDLLLLYSAGKLKLMNALAAKRAKDITYADSFDTAKLHDVRFVKSATKPALPDSGLAAYAKGSKLDTASVTAGLGFLVKTPDSNLVWLKIEAIQGTGTSASAKLTLDIAPF
ncbi:MAG: hypothetical protein JF616_15875 [Fibrobacteres bacterium]|jgi:hypothetical protein|nr:hypothetical protein [Fibrobacterota bacterium]